MKNIKNLFLVAIASLSLFSCDDWIDVNESPNNPVASQITPDLMLANAEATTYRVWVRTSNRLGSLLMNEWGFNVNAFAVSSPEEFSYIIDNGFYATIWDNLYLQTANFSNIINHPSTGYDNHKAIAKIMKSYYFQYLVDLYGDVPYTEAHKGVLDITPKYDNDKAVYRDLIVQINAAIATLNASNSSRVVGNEDVMFGGNKQNWIKFANTLKLRILLRQSQDASSASYLTTEFASLNGASFLDIDAKINPGYANSDAARQNPFYSLHFDVTNASTQTFEQFRASKYFADELNLSSAIDPRRGRLFNLVGGDVVGVIQGDLSVNNGGTAPAAMSSIGPGILTSSLQSGIVISLAETNLLLAEAIHRNYLPGGAAAAQTAFDAGVNASMAQQVVTAANATTYLTAVNTVVGKGYGALTATPAQQIQAIQYQKKIALYGVSNACESYIEYNRTRLLDNIPLAIGNVTKPNRPRRLPYPASEFIANSLNIPAQGDVFVTGPFWRN
jgi:Starch-binding associating with outer membrane